MADDDTMTIPKEVIFQIIASMEALMDAFSVLQTAYDGYKLTQSGKDIGPPLNLNSGEYDDIVESEARLGTCQINVFVCYPVSMILIDR